jgi:hypothetical protein
MGPVADVSVFIIEKVGAYEVVAEALPGEVTRVRIRNGPPCQSAVHMVNWQTGEGMVGTAWSDQAAMDVAAEARRPQARSGR